MLDQGESILTADQKEKILELWNKCGGVKYDDSSYVAYDNEFWLFVESLILVANTKAIIGEKISLNPSTLVQTIAEWPITNRDENLDAVNM